MLPSLRQEYHLAALWAAAVFAYFAHDAIVHPASGIQAWARIGMFFAIILWGAFSVVRHASALAHILGEPYGTLVLTLAVTVIEVAFIVSAELGGKAEATLARDTVFSVLMITVNGMVGLCLLIGGLRYGEPEYNLEGTRSFLVVIVPVAVIALILPNYTTIPGPILSMFHSAFFGVLILILYGVFLSVQTVRHPYYFKQPEPKRARKTRETVEPAPVEHVAMFHAGMLVLTLLPVVYLTEALAELTGVGLGAIGAPAALAGVIIAVLVLSPEGMGALQASSRNELQRAINISLGSALATVGLTIPAILAVSVWRGVSITLGLENEEAVLLGLTFLVTAFTFGGAHTNVLMGAVHMVLFLAFIALLFDP